MSRCFPFPPPGYEKKARTDDVDLPKKEKHKEKKHKKEKKDKEKREGKDRKDKDKNDGKHRDKKDRKEKSKDKKKDKEREKDRDKTSTSQEKKIPAQVESCNGDPKLNHKEREQVKVQNIISNEKKQDTPFRGLIGEKPVEKSLDNGVNDKFVLDLRSRIEDEEKGPASQSMERFLFTGRTNHDRMVKNETGIMSGEKEKKKERRVDDIRKMDEQGVRVGAAISASVQNIAGKEKIENKGVNIRGGFQNRAEEIPRTLETSIKPRDKNYMDRRVDDIGKMDGQGVRIGAPISARTLVQNIVAKQKKENNGSNISDGFQNRDEDVPRNLEKNIEPRDKKYKKESEEKRGSKRTDKDKEKKSHGKHKDREKEKKKEKKAKEKIGEKIKDRLKVKDSIKNGHVVGQNIRLPPLVPDGDRNLIISQNIKLPQLVPDGDRNLILGQNTKLPPFLPDGDKNLVIRQNIKLLQPIPGGDRNLIVGQNTEIPPFFSDGDRTPAVEGNFKKRKGIEANGFLHGESLHPLICDETNVVPNKKIRPTPHPWIENGRKLEFCQAPVLHTLDRKVPPPNNLIKANNTEHTVNGKIEVQPLSIPLKKSSSSSSSSRSKAGQIDQAPPVKPPHPDAKYLNEVLLVPKIDKWCEFDDEEWLFASRDRVSLSAGSITKAAETPSIWAEAMQIESADVCALPYVIPY